MNDAAKNDKAPHREKSGRGAFRSVVEGLTSLRFALSVVALIAVVAIVGTIVPQGEDVARYLAVHPEAKARYELLGHLGFTHVFKAWWFLGLLGLLSLSLLACTCRRCATAGRARGRARGRAVGSILTHISLLLILSGGIIRGVMGQRGQISFHEGETTSVAMLEGKPTQLPFAVHLVKFETEFYQPGEGGMAAPPERLSVIWPAKGIDTTLSTKLDETQWVVPEGETRGTPGALRVAVRRWIPDFVVDMQTREVRSRSDAPLNPAVLVEAVQGGKTNNLWLFAKFPDFNMHATGSEKDGEPPFRFQYQTAAPQVKDYKSTLQILEGGAPIREATIEVNSPLSYRGYRLYQSGYSANDPTWTSLQVVRDPGVPLVYLGFALMIVGLVMVFYVYPAEIGARDAAAGAGER